MSQLNWKRSVGQIVMANKGRRLLGFTAVRRGAGVTTISRRVASTMAAGGEKTLMVCVSELYGRAARNGADNNPAGAGALRAEIVPSAHGYDILNGTDGDALMATYSAVQLRDVLDNELAEYARIVLDLPPVCDDASDSISSASFATVCDGVVLVCLLGTDRRSEIAETAAILNSSGAKLAGIVSNEHKQKDFTSNLLQSRFAQAMQ